MELFDYFVERAEENGIYLIPCFYGHMSGENTPRLQGSFYSDENTEKMLSVMQEVVRRHDDKNIILSWDPSNEPINREIPRSSQDAYTWAKKNYDSLKQLSEKPIMLGEGATKRKILRNNGGFHLEELGGLTGKDGCIDGYKIHDYMAGRRTAFKLKSYEGLGKPLLLEEFGHPSLSLWLRGGQEEQAGRIRTQSFSSLLSENCAAMPWCWQDFPMNRRPYSYVLKETSFGLHDLRGVKKPAGVHFKRFVDFVTEFEPQNYDTDAKIAVLLPRGAYDSVFNQNFREDPELLERQSFEIFSMLSKSHFECDIVREDSDIDNYEMLIIPDVEVSDDFLCSLDRFLENEKTVLSFGVLPESFSGLNLNKRKKINCNKIKLGSEDFDVKFRDVDYYEVDTVAETIIGEIGDRPVFIKKEKNSGELITSLCPFDKHLTKMGVMESEEYRVLGKVVGGAGICKEFDADCSEIDISVLSNGKQRLVMLINYSKSDLSFRLKNPKNRRLKDVDSGQEYTDDVDIEMDPRDVRVFEGNW